MSLAQQYREKLKDRKSSLSFRERKDGKKGKHSVFSWKNHLRNAGRSNEAFEMMVSRLRLEELIALKLELASASIGKGMFGYPLFMAIDKIVRLATIIFASSVTATRQEAAALLGLSTAGFKGIEYTSMRGRNLESEEFLEAIKFDKLVR